MTSSTLHRLSLFLACLSLSSSALAASIPGHDHDHHEPARSLPGTWYQPDDHPARALFGRDASDAANFASVGSSTWSAGFPESTPDPSKLPKAWVDALNAAIAAGNIPDIPVSTPQDDGLPTYGGLKPDGPEVCSTTYQCYENPNVIINAPDGVVGISFDDGPLSGTSDKLYSFLKENNVRATHFMIGVNILTNPDQFSTAYETNGDDIAVHTWTHPYMTTLSNEMVLGELGWTMQLIYNSTGGRLPKYWRPPYGDADNRVISIARYVFGLKTVVWNQDTGDWAIGEDPNYTLSSVHAELTKWYSGPKSPGLIILEHELTDNTVTAFIDSFPLIGSNGWKTVSVAELDGESAYQNADGDSGTASAVSGIVLSGASSSNGNSSSSLNAASSSSASTGSASHSSTSSSTSAFLFTSPSASSAANPTVAPAGTSGASAATGVPGSGSKQANVTVTTSSATGSGSSAAASATNSASVKQQQSGAGSLVQMAFWDVRGLVGALVTLFVSVFALA
ncbi:hypothetical protein EIP86_001779 [Pleurotus ostreatoroseus]|nr:hypothetical protein EIP86_001779 [Pleurotus ostreatoroseus]